MSPKPGTVSRHYVLAAGGTGGHLTPAFALAHELERRGHHVALITDERGATIPGKPEFLPAHVLAATGLVALFGGQAFVNILVNLQLFPSKGLTLPLVSYGGSSTIAQCFLVGLLLATTRRNPYLSREKFDWHGALEREGER